MRDTGIVASIVAGDSDGLAAAYDQYAGPLFKYCRTLLGEHADAADAVRDTFVIAAYRFGRLRDGEPPRAWLYAVTRAECHRIARAKKGTPSLDEAPRVTGGRAGAGGRAERAQLRALFEDAAAGLSPGEREVVELQLRQGLETDEVATVLGVSRNHALALLARARSQLEACLGVLLVGRSGRGECGELGALLAGWDGRLTAALRKRVHRHIERCATCSARRARELRPAMLLDLSPGAALAAGAAESLRLAFGAPSGLRAHTIALATGRGPGAVAHSAAVLARAGAFGRHGFPGPARAGKGGPAGPPGAGQAKAPRSSPPRQAVVGAAVVIAVAAAAVAFALAGNDEHVTVSADHEPSHPAHPPASAPAAAAPAAGQQATGQPASGKTATGKPATGRAGARRTAAGPRPASSAREPAAQPLVHGPAPMATASAVTANALAPAGPPGPAPGAASSSPAAADGRAAGQSPPPASSAPGGVPAPTRTTATPAPATSGREPATSGPARPKPPRPPSGTPPPGSPPPSARPGTPPPHSPPPGARPGAPPSNPPPYSPRSGRPSGAPPGPVPGALSVLPDGGTVTIVPGLAGSLVTLRAAGGTVAWSAAVAGDPGHVVSVSPSAGTLTTADRVATVRITVSGLVRCGPGPTAPCPTVTVSPGGATFAVRTGWVLPLPPGRESPPGAGPAGHGAARPASAGPASARPAPADPALAGRGPSGQAPTGQASARSASFGPAFVHPASVDSPPASSALASQARGSSTSPAALSRQLTTRR